MTTKQSIRREKALSRLKTQLASGVKPEKVDGKTTKNTISLDDSDKRRIEKEIAILSGV
jgi:hypothetical protein